MKYLYLSLVAVVVITVYINRAYSHVFKYFNDNNPGCPKVNTTFNFPSAVSSTKQLTYVSLGDSLTAGAGATDEKESYPYLLAKSISEKTGKNVTLHNIAEPGAVSADVLSLQAPKVADLHPDIVTLAIGINDFHNQVKDSVFRENMTQIINALSTSTSKLYVLTIPYLGNRSAMWPPLQTLANWRTKHYNSIVKEAVGSKATIIDLYSLTLTKAFRDKTYYSRDGFHPSASTYDYWSKILYDHIDP